MKSLIQIIIFLLLASTSFSQDAKRLFDDGEYAIIMYDYDVAERRFKALVEDYPDNSNYKYRLGVVYMLLQKPEKAIIYLEPASKNIADKYQENDYEETKAHPDVFNYLGDAYFELNKLENAISAYSVYKELIELKEEEQKEVELKIQTCKNAIHLMSNPKEVEFTNMGEVINSREDELLPFLSEDESLFFYTSMKESYDGFENKIKRTEFEEGNWKTPRNIQDKISVNRDMQALGISNNNELMLLVKHKDLKSLLYYSELDGRHYSKAKKFGREINLKSANYACISKDGTTLYFSAENKSAGFGGYDIYKSVKNKKGDWGDAVNLGETINTPYDDIAPILLENEEGTKLFFSSKGHFSMGGYDVFFSEMKDGGNWSTPQNMGYPFNNTLDNTYYFPIKDGREGYLSIYSDKKGYGGYDIYKVVMKSPLIRKEKLDKKDLVTALDEGDTTIYTIQMKATKKPTESMYLRELENVEVIQTKDGFIRYCYGLYKGRDEAEKDLQKILQMGFTAATVKNRNEDSLLNVSDVDIFAQLGLIDESETNKNVGKQLSEDLSYKKNIKEATVLEEKADSLKLLAKQKRAQARNSEDNTEIDGLLAEAAKLEGEAADFLRRAEDLYTNAGKRTNELIAQEKQNKETSQELVAESVEQVSENDSDDIDAEKNNEASAEEQQKAENTEEVAESIEEKVEDSNQETEVEIESKENNIRVTEEMNKKAAEQLQGDKNYQSSVEEAQILEEKADSLNYLASIKKKEMNDTDSPAQKEVLKEEIVDLEAKADTYTAQAEEKYTQVGTKTNETLAAISQSDNKDEQISKPENIAESAKGKDDEEENEVNEVPDKVQENDLVVNDNEEVDVQEEQTKNYIDDNPKSDVINEESGKTEVEEEDNLAESTTEPEKEEVVKEETDVLEEEKGEVVDDEEENSENIISEEIHKEVAQKINEDKNIQNSIVEAQSAEEKSDSLFYLAKIKRQELKQTNDETEKEQLEEEIAELTKQGNEYLAEAEDAYLETGNKTNELIAEAKGEDIKEKPEVQPGNIRVVKNAESKQSGPVEFALTENNLPVYTIQISTVKKPFENASYFGAVENVVQVKCNDGKYRYITGRYVGYEQAKDALEEVRQNGYKDAFVVSRKSIQNKHISSSESNALAYFKAENKVVYDDNQYYSIQIASAKQIISKQFFKSPYEIYISKASNGYYRYYTGKFNDKSEAQNKLSELRNNGYKDAYVIKWKEGNLQETIAEATITKKETVSSEEYIYTVQIAASKKDVDESAFNGLTPIYKFKKASGYIAYTYGKYKSLSKAQEAHQKAVNAGYKDAFISKLSRY